MYTRVRYPLIDMVRWTYGDAVIFVANSIIPTVMYHICGYTSFRVPWTGLMVLGTAVAFLIGFQNSSAYERIWEARKIWGGIVNATRTWSNYCRDLLDYKGVDDADEKKKQMSVLVRRHIAWLTALRYKMREPREWEVFQQQRANQAWHRQMFIPEKCSSLEDNLRGYLPAEEFQNVMDRSNKAAAILEYQSTHLTRLKDQGRIWDHAHLQFMRMVENLLTLQGQTERIKNFPYPRQYATVGHFLVWTFVLLVPYALVPEFAALGEQLELNATSYRYYVWLAVPFSTIICWTFHTIEKVGKAGENPFEGTANDVPISAISRGLERELLESLGEPDETIPAMFPTPRHTTM